MGLLVGGLAPSLLFGVSGVFAKASNKTGIGLGPYLMMTALAILIVGIGCWFLFPNRNFNPTGSAHALAMGLLWGLGTALVALALSVYAMPLGKLAPLYNMNTLVAVLLALWIFSEWRTVNVTQLIMGSLLIVAGGVLVSRA